MPADRQEGRFAASVYLDDANETRSRIAAWRVSANALEAFAMARELPSRVPGA